MFDATIQVLLNGGLERLTTTRVAERAGVSVGSLYQYFPNKRALMAAVLERHLLNVVTAVEVACIDSKGQNIETMASVVIDAFVKAKMDQPETSKVLYAVAAELDGEAIVNRMAMRSQAALREMLATASDCHFLNPNVVAFMISTAAVGPVQALLASNAPPEMLVTVRAQLVTMMDAYLKASAVRTSDHN
jgi:AcrR family transcriptional regulator